MSYLEKTPNGSEIHQGFSDFLLLPLKEPTVASGFFYCPAAVCVTNKKLWVVHFHMADFDKHSDATRFEKKETADAVWPHFSLDYKERVLLLFTAGRVGERLTTLTKIVERKTQGKAYKIGFDKAVDFNLLFNCPNGKVLEVALVQNNLPVFDKKISLK